MDKASYSRNEYMVHHIEYGPYEREIRAPSSTNSSINNLTNLDMGYHRSSSSSTGSSAGSGKQLVKPHYLSPQSHAKVLKGRLERSYNFKDERYYHRTKGSVESSPAIHKKPTTFFLGPPSPDSTAIGYHTPQRLSPPQELRANPKIDRLRSNQMVRPTFNMQLDPGLLSPPDINSKVSSMYDAYWHLPNNSKWCVHQNCGLDDKKCSQCQFKEDDTSSICSSVNPPPTFTASDNYRPIRRKPQRCGAIFIATLIFSTFVLLLIAAFILYVEIVLKQVQYVPDPM